MTYGVENTTDEFIDAIKKKIKLLSWVVLLIISIVLFLNVRIISEILNYVPVFSVAIMLVVVSGLVLIGFYLSRKISLNAINQLNGLVLALQHEINVRRNLEIELQNLSFTDELTGLHNRRGFFALVEHQFIIAKRNKKDVVMLYADLDNFKMVNDRFGHNEGDILLRAVANILKSTFRESDIIARIGGDEFVIFPSIEQDAVNADRMIVRLQEKIKAYNLQNQNYSLSLSIGIARFEKGFSYSVDALLSKADHMMYEQKRMKKGLF